MWCFFFKIKEKQTVWPIPLNHQFLVLWILAFKGTLLRMSCFCVVCLAYPDWSVETLAFILSRGMPQRWEKVKVTWGGGKGMFKAKCFFFFIFTEWPKFPENKQLLPSYNGSLMFLVLLCLLSSLPPSVGRAALRQLHRAVCLNIVTCHHLNVCLLW